MQLPVDAATARAQVATAVEAEQAEIIRTTADELNAMLLVDNWVTPALVTVRVREAGGTRTDVRIRAWRPRARAGRATAPRPPSGWPAA